MLKIGDHVEHRDYGIGQVLELAGRDPRWGQSYIVAFGRVWHRRSSWCVFEDEVTLIEKGENNERND